MTIVRVVASARAPALGVYPSVRTASSTRRRTSAEIALFPESAYDAVLRETPATRATSPMVATVPPLIEPVRQ